MVRRTSMLWIGLALHLLSPVSFGQGRLFMIPAGDSPSSFPSGTTVVNVDGPTVQAGGFTLTLEVFLESTSPSKVRGYQIVLDDATGGVGTVEYNPAGAVLPTIDTVRGEYLFTSAVSTLATVVDLGAPARLADAVEDASGDSVAVTTAVYLGEITYEFSTNANGSFSIAFVSPGTDPLSSQTIVVDDTNTPIALTTDSVTINITGLDVPAVETWGVVVLALLLLVVGVMLLGRRRWSVGALVIVGVTALLVASPRITWAIGGCHNFGDVDQNGAIGQTDLDCVRDGFRGVFSTCALVEVDVAPCAGNGRVDLFDILSVFDAFPSQGVPACGEVCAFEPPSWTAPPATIDETPRTGDSNPMLGVFGFSGEEHITIEDLVIDEREMTTAWVRTYRSQIGPNTPQGNGWDFSYNIFLEQVGSNLILHDGQSRRDTYSLQSDGTWTRPGFFRQIIQNPDNSYTVVFPHLHTWDINQFDASPQSGKLTRIVGRNGNTMTFSYDATGRLTQIAGTLDNPSNPRKLTIAYDANGFISTVTDFIGRQVKYQYYNAGDIGGDAGDLKSVTTPAVIGTPTGNDFPTGKTTVYTYSTGFTDARLNHNLLTITDPKGQTYLVNEYAPTLNPSDLDFDRIVRQTLGNSGEVLDVTYAPDPGGFDVLAVFNDRVGNVSECAYDKSHRLRRGHKYTGRATPNVATTISANRPTGPLRTSDPTVFTTLYEYNFDSLITRIVLPNQNERLYEYDAANPAKRSQGNTLRSRQLPGLLGGDQVEIDNTYVYDPQFNFITQRTDGRANTWSYAYDVSGNLTQRTYPDMFVEDYEYNAFGQVTRHVLPSNGISRRDDTFTYYVQADGTQNGYLKESIIDAPGLALTTTYEYDPVGNITRTVDPKLQDTLVTYNALDQVVQVDSRAVNTPAGPVRYQNRFYYDGNDNVVRVDTLDVDDQGVTNSVDPYFTTIYEYDILNYLIRDCQESGNNVVPTSPPKLDCVGLPDSEFIHIDYQYDSNRNRVLVRSGEAAEGREPNNTNTTLYDERDLVFQRVRAATDASQSTIQFDYDLNENLQTTREGLESVPRVKTYTYDGYDRVTTTTDPMGNVQTFQYDANDNVTREQTDGELNDQLGNTSNVRLAETRFVYDPENRVILRGDLFFDRVTQATLGGDGESTTLYVYNDNYQIVSVTDDNSHATTTAYDSVNRVNSVIDALNNVVSFVYDPNSNVITRIDLDRSDVGSPDQAFVTQYTYDAIDRVTRTTDSSNNDTNMSYDSRDNTRLVVDPLLVETRNEYDALSRLTRSIRDMNGTGADPADPVDIVTGRTWDDNSRIVTRFDDSGNTTTYEYDSLNRMTRENSADTTTTTYVYDVHDNITSKTDQNGSVVTGTFDLLNRRNSNTITPGSGVSSDTTFELFRYDGADRVVRAEDDDSVVTYAYDSNENMTREVLTISPPGLLSTSGTTTFVYDGVGNPIVMVYPSGRQITTTYDNLDRKKTITDTTGAPTSVATYNYIGPNRVELRDYGNNTRCVYDYDGIQGVANQPGDAGVKQIIHTAHAVIANPPFDERVYSWDPLYNKLSRLNITPPAPGAPQPLVHDYEYDPMYRMVRTTVTDLSITPPPPPLRVTDYTLDGVGNRLNVTNDNCSGLYNLDSMIPPADFQMNQYSATGCDSRLYDENGNLNSITDPLGSSTNLFFNYRNELTSHEDLTTGDLATYTYDAVGRRVARSVTVAATSNETRYYYDDIHCIEEQDGSGTTEATYVYGRVVDEVLQMRRGAIDSYYHCDDLGNVMAVTDATGTVVEQYEYQDYGEPEFISPTGVPITESQIGNPYLFTGRRYDNESGLYYYRARYLDPIAGRFIQRDPIGTWGDDANLGNASTYVGNNPWTNTDPTGERTCVQGCIHAAHTDYEDCSYSAFTTIGYCASMTMDYLNECLDGCGYTGSRGSLWNPGGGGGGNDPILLADELPKELVIGGSGHSGGGARGLKKGNSVQLIGFGTFSISNRAARTGRNPQTGASIQIKAKAGGGSTRMNKADLIEVMHARNKLFVGGLSWNGGGGGHAGGMATGRRTYEPIVLSRSARSFAPNSGIGIFMPGLLRGNNRGTIRPHDLMFFTSEHILLGRSSGFYSPKGGVYATTTKLQEAE